MTVNTVRGSLDGSELTIGIVVSRFNETITENLLSGALESLERTGVASENVTVVHVPGSFEIPLAAQKLVSAGEVDAVICLGALIRGETPHFDYLAAQVTRSLSSLALDSGIPVTYGVLTTDTVEQAMNRAGLKFGNKGSEAALVAVEMANLINGL